MFPLIFNCTLVAGVVVEIDETVLYKDKHNRGTLRRSQFSAFGMLERGTNKVR